MSKSSFHHKTCCGLVLRAAIYAMDDFGFLYEVQSRKFKLVMVGAREE